MSGVVESLARRYEAIKPHLTERQRRVWLGSEARELGSGGVALVADAVRVSLTRSGGDAPNSMISHRCRWVARSSRWRAYAPRSTTPNWPWRSTSWSTLLPR